MKTNTKLIIIASAVIVLGAVFAFLHFKKKGEAQNVNDIYGFMVSFNDALNKGNVDSALKFFSPEKKKRTVFKNLVIRLMSKKQPGEDAPLPVVSLNIGSADIKIISANVSMVKVPTSLVYNQLDLRPTAITFRLIKWGDRFKIINADMTQFMPDYVDYQNYLESKIIPDSARFGLQTLAAFKAAEKLKAAYDSVIWFGHVGKETYFYVVKGKWKWNPYRDGQDGLDTAQYKMGLVGPGLTEIIPAEYSLIHNIGGTFDNLVEVEKGNKRGFFDLNGKKVVPVIYDAIYPVAGTENLAVLPNGNDFFWLKNDYTVSDKADLKIADILQQLKKNGPFEFSDAGPYGGTITELNSREEAASIYVAPSYLVDLNLIDPIRQFRNPLRKYAEYSEEHNKYVVGSAIHGNNSGESWLESVFYDVKDYFLGGRAEFYENNTVLLVDNKHNKFYATHVPTEVFDEEGGSSWQGDPCQVKMVKPINDSLFEIKSTVYLSNDLYDTTKAIGAGTYYTYIALKNGKLFHLPNERVFGFTKYVKMDDSYINACYNIVEGSDYKHQNYITINKITPEMLRYMKNEIYADYAYQFKDKRWAEIFASKAAYYSRGQGNHVNANVDDSLTVIDKYNIAFINQKLNALKSADKPRVSLPK